MSEEGEAGDSAIGSGREAGAVGYHCCGCGGDGRAGGFSAGARVQVGWAVDLSVVVVCGASTAEAAATLSDGAVREEDGGRVVSAGDGHGGELFEGIGGGVEEFRSKLGGVVAERVGVDLAASDEDGAVGEDDAVGEGALVGHVGYGLYRWGGGGRADGDDVGV